MPEPYYEFNVGAGSEHKTDSKSMPWMQADDYEVVQHVTPDFLRS